MTFLEYRQIILDYEMHVIHRTRNGLIDNEKSTRLLDKLDEWNKTGCEVLPYE